MPRVTAQFDGPATVTLRILATADLHAHLMPYDYLNDRADPRLGLARTALLIRQARQEVPFNLLFDNGDFLTGTPIGETSRSADPQAQPVDPTPMIAAMNRLGYAAVALGNHDFDHGLGPVQRAAALAEFPLLCANVTAPDSQESWLPQIMLTRQVPIGPDASRPLNIGVFGVAPPQIVNWDRTVLPSGMRAADMLETARGQIASLQAQGADLVIGLCHTGFGETETGCWLENALGPLSRLEGLDALIGGHTHVTFPATSETLSAPPGMPAPVTMPGFFGSDLSIIDLDLQWDAGWRVTDRRAFTRPIAPSAGGPEADHADPDLVNAFTAPHLAAIERMRQPMGRSDLPLHSYFALAAPADPTLTLIARAQAERAQAALLRLDGSPDLPVLSVVAPFRCGGMLGPDNYIDLSPGPLTERNATELYLYPNFPAVVECDGLCLRDWLERSAGLFRQVRPGQRDLPLHEAAFPSYNFDVIFGLTYEFDLREPPRYDPAGNLTGHSGRVRAIRFRGEPVADDQRFLVAINNYRLGGGGQFSMVTRLKPFWQSRHTLRQVVVDYLRERQGVLPPPEPVWSLTTIPDTTTSFLSSPKAARLLDQPEAPPHISALGPAEDGFWRYRLSLGGPD